MEKALAAVESRLHEKDLECVGLTMQLNKAKAQVAELSAR
jgi:hypothetical protein